ncbi:HAD-IC family P-type ATPase [Pseudogulbenkiania sp. MAI-1]|uniref:cation-translocating P-type ATPase n=1 Tax=Pseudogulbenkiania sp. MAI-1 TaxID=990370 RepID=UPI00045EAC41|nr:HAD-IC family P-type ATPase [Pseudogulbenkiania sp. MAI-1]
MNGNTPPPWHHLEIHDTLARLASTAQGLSSAEAARRLTHHGPNVLPEAPRPGPWRRLLAQFHNVLIYVLLASAVVTLAIGDWVDTAVIVGVVLINAAIGFLQEGKAEAALNAIRHMLAPQATVLRDGERLTLAASQLVPGDVVLLQSGDKVPADLRLLEIRNLRLDESALSGESLPVDKNPAPLPPETVLSDRRNMAYAGSVVSYGQGSGVVVATGRDTELGRITRLLATVQADSTPLTRMLQQFARWLTALILLVAVLTVLLGVYWRGQPWPEMFMAAVGLVVAAIPEGLPAIVTITLAIGVERMARQRAIMRRLPAIETLGAVSVICTDKTGTLTCNEMTAVRLVTARHEVSVSGAGYRPDGALHLAGTPLPPGRQTDVDELVRAAALCNDARLLHHDGHWRLCGDPTEGALLTLAHKAEWPPEVLHEQWPRRDAIPFEAEYRFMATLHHDRNGHRQIYLKGAPEVVLARASHELAEGRLTELNAARWQQTVAELAAQGMRVLALAGKSQPHAGEELDFADVEDGLTLLGLVGLIDPPRPEAVRAVASCQQAGIRVKMITGDHALTATAIARELGIGDGRLVLSGEELEAMDDARLAEAVRHTDVFARTSPEHKLRLVQALKRHGQVVAMTGDGVNDAPALKQADVGVAMGGKGTEAAKEAADMVITDDNFASLTRAVAEGRTVYDNLKKTVLFILPTNIGEAAIIVAAVVAGLPLPITPVQILWINMVTAVTLALALAFEPSEGLVMRRPPRRADASLLDRLFLWRLLLVGALMVAVPFALYLDAVERGLGEALARTVAVNSMVAIEIAYLFNIRQLDASAISRHGLGGNRVALLSVALLVLLQLALSYAAPMQALFGTAGLAGGEWLKILTGALACFLLLEGEKALLRRYRQLTRATH